MDSSTQLNSKVEQLSTISTKKEPETAVSTPPPPQQKSLIALLVVLLLLLVVCVGGVFAYYWQREKNNTIATQIVPTTPEPSQSNMVTVPQPTPVSTVGWKTFTSSYGYTLRYPQTWAVDYVGGGPGVEIKTEDSPTVMISNTNCVKDSVRCVSIILVVDDLKTSQYNHADAKTYYESFYKEINSPILTLLDERETTVTTIPAFESIFFEGRGGPTDIVLSKYVVFLKGDQAWRISFQEGYVGDGNTIQSPSDWQYDEIFDQILASMTFSPT